MHMTYMKVHSCYVLTLYRLQGMKFCTAKSTAVMWFSIFNLKIWLFCPWSWWCHQHRHRSHFICAIVLLTLKTIPPSINLPIDCDSLWWRQRLPILFLLHRHQSKPMLHRTWIIQHPAYSHDPTGVHPSVHPSTTVQYQRHQWIKEWIAGKLWKRN